MNVDPNHYVGWLRKLAVNSAGFVMIAVVYSVGSLFMLGDGGYSSDGVLSACLACFAAFGWVYCRSMSKRDLGIFAAVTGLYFPTLIGLFWIFSFAKDLFVNSRFLNGPALAQFYDLPSAGVPLLMIFLATGAMCISGWISSNQKRKRFHEPKSE